MKKAEHSNKIPWFQIIKCGWKHRLGNLIQAFVHVAENLIILVTFGIIYPNFSMKWIMYRLCDSKFFYEQKQNKDENI